MIDGDIDTDSVEEDSEPEESEESDDNTKINMHPVWVTPPSNLTVLEQPTIVYGNEASLGYVYGNAVLLVHVGPIGNRATLQ